MLKLTGKNLPLLQQQLSQLWQSPQPLSQQLLLRQTHSPWQLSLYRQAQLM